MRRLGALLGLWLLGVAYAAPVPPDMALRLRPQLVREAHFVLGLDAPVPMFAAQIEQESGWRPGITAWDNGRGLAQFMDPTAAQVARLYPALGPAAPYDPLWSMRALVRYDDWLFKRVQGATPCQRWGAALKSYNAGLGYVQQAQRASSAPGQWFFATEYVPTRQTPKNFEYSRMYPRWILFKRQPTYLGWGTYTCQGEPQ